jgi:dienelactone hydrolase
MAEARQVRVPIAGAQLEGALTLPLENAGIVLFAHGSGSSRFSPRNRFVAGELQGAGLGTLLIDLLTRGEEEEDQLTRALRFDIPMLAGRVVAMVDWLAARPDTRGLGIGIFGASTGAGAALIAAAERPDLVRAVVSRGGRPDLAGAHLARVRAPTLLIVGANDDAVIHLNRQARAALTCPSRLDLVPGATHLFEEPGTLEQVAQLARAWFTEHLRSSRAVVESVPPPRGSSGPRRP